MLVPLADFLVSLEGEATKRVLNAWLALTPLAQDLIIAKVVKLGLILARQGLIHHSIAFPVRMGSIPLFQEEIRLWSARHAILDHFRQDLAFRNVFNVSLANILLLSVQQVHINAAHAPRESTTSLMEAPFVFLALLENIQVK